MLPDATDTARDGPWGSRGEVPAPPQSAQWFAYLDADVLGPLGLGEMRALAEEGRLTPRSQTTRRSPPEWKSAAQDDLLAPIFADGSARQGAVERPEDTRPSPNSTATPILVADRGVETPSPSTLPPSVPPPLPLPIATPDTSGQNTTLRYRSGLPPRRGEDRAGSSAPASPAPLAARRPAGPTPDPDMPLRNKGEGAAAHAVERAADPDLMSPIAPGILSLSIPGLGQFLNGSYARAAILGLSALFLWQTGPGWIIHIIAAVEAYRTAYRSARPS